MICEDRWGVLPLIPFLRILPSFDAVAEESL